MEPQNNEGLRRITIVVEEVFRFSPSRNQWVLVGNPNHSIQAYFCEADDRIHFLQVNETVGRCTEIIRSSLYLVPQILPEEPNRVVFSANNHSVHTTVGLERAYSMIFANPGLAVVFCFTYQHLLERNRGLNGAPNDEPDGEDDALDDAPRGDDELDLDEEDNVFDVAPNNELDDFFDDRSDGEESVNSRSWPNARNPQEEAAALLHEQNNPGEEAAALLDGLNIADDQEE
ncbi:predicted protein [Chaetoceros tenuissimus]|uniref:Uncharacterized protein n=1 Tax=Chaetoceros tenuissimus TaxID=426638 RepID=A0AAD3HBJ1_9STRA|nr:predicted protein [Chaetoceros tenuissimus]